MGVNMYKVVEEHHRPCYRRGDLEDEWVVINTKMFKLKRDAKAYIESKLKGKPEVFRDISKYLYMCGYFTNRTWVNENTGNECVETYQYRLTKERIQ